MNRRPDDDGTRLRTRYSYRDKTHLEGSRLQAVAAPIVQQDLQRILRISVMPIHLIPDPVYKQLRDNGAPP